ncbi:MAG: SagB/ThcOx family dehydrogenase [Actinobacteria bacterium]|nr:SagB/ThcOx family dehydrogenase [Actinomycetota bacterium]
MKSNENLERIELPQPNTSGTMSLEEALLKRRSVRSYTDEELTTSEISQLLWAAQGITDSRGFRTAPSAGALYPLNIYITKSDGTYTYDPTNHELIKLSESDIRRSLYAAGLYQEAIADAPVVFVITAVFKRTTGKYGERGIQYVYLEAGHAAQNLLLQATALDLGGVTIGAFVDEQVSDIMALPAKETPIYIIPVGHPEE